MIAVIIQAARLALVSPMLLAASPVLAGQYQPAPTPEADALAADMRILGNNPVDLPALISAGERTLKLGDIEAAAAFFQRAERISPANGQIKAGKARTLVQLGRPGEALQLFNAAEALGYDVGLIGADRGLAYDLIGEQERAQRTYRAALKRQPDDETQRRYALSLGISGKPDKALEVLDSLLRRSDRAAWRVRAVVLAMNGDVAGAERISASMLPPMMATGLQPFFRILGGLNPADRAFAVHFGEVRPSAERIADARLIPALPELAPEPVAAVQVASAAPIRLRVPPVRGRRQRGKAPVEVAVVTAPAVPVPAPLPTPPRVVMVTPVPAPMQQTPRVRSAMPDQVASARSTGRSPERNQPIAAGRTPLPTPPTEVAVQTVVPAAPTRVEAAAPPRPVSGPLLDLPKRDPVATKRVAATDSAPDSAPIAQGSASVPVAEKAPVSAQQPTPALVSASDSAPAPAPDSGPSRPKPVASEESILARIIATIGVPASELEVASAKPVAVATADVRKPTPAEKPASPDKKALEKKALADKAAAEKKLADKKIADEKAAKLKAAKADPSRIWVQVAGGANVDDLPKAWARLRDKAPAMLKSKSAYTTPLRFTNRLLTGPFKSEAEAQNFVNQIAKSGLTGFVFTSDAGQKIEKLPAR